MPGQRYTHSEYALQHTVELLGNHLYTLYEHNQIHIYRVVFRFTQLDGIDYLVVRYLNTGLLPFEEFSEDQSFDEGS